MGDFFIVVEELGRRHDANNTEISRRVLIRVDGLVNQTCGIQTIAYCASQNDMVVHEQERKISGEKGKTLESNSSVQDS